METGGAAPRRKEPTYSNESLRAHIVGPQELRSVSYTLPGTCRRPMYMSPNHGPNCRTTLCPPSTFRALFPEGSLRIPVGTPLRKPFTGIPALKILKDRLVQKTISQPKPLSILLGMDESLLLIGHGLNWQGVNLGSNPQPKPRTGIMKIEEWGLFSEGALFQRAIPLVSTCKNGQSQRLG